MLIADVELPYGAVAELASCLERARHPELAMRVGLAVDTNRQHLHLTPHERATVLTTLHDCPKALAPLRNALVS